MWRNDKKRKRNITLGIVLVLLSLMDYVTLFKIKDDAVIKPITQDSMESIKTTCCY